MDDGGDPTKKALFSLSGITTGATRTFTLPNTSSELAILAGTQTFTGNKTFFGTLTASGTVTVSAASASIGTTTTTATYGMGTGLMTAGVTKTVNLGTGGASGSTTVVNIGSATAGAVGTTVVNTPTVTFANSVTQVSMPQANLTAQLVGLGGATADSTKRMSVNTPAVLPNNAGAGIDVTVNRAAAGNNAAFAFKTGFSSRALIGLLGNDDFSFKVSPDGSAFFEAIRIDRTSGQVELPQPTILPGLSAAPSAAPSGKEGFCYDRWPKGEPTKRGALTCDLFLHQRGEELFEMDVLFPDGGDVTRALRCTVKAENLTKPMELPQAPVAAKVGFPPCSTFWFVGGALAAANDRYLKILQLQCCTCKRRLQARCACVAPEHRDQRGSGSQHVTFDFMDFRRS